VLFQNLAVSKHNSGIELIPHEKARLIGVTLGINNGRIDSRILKQFGYDTARAAADEVVSYYRLMCKQRRNILSPADIEALHNLEVIRACKRARLLISEVMRSGISAPELSSSADRIAVIQAAVANFEPHVLLSQRKQIYWDLESYLHIALRHVKEMQLGQFKGKSAFPYQVSELETLVEQVLKQIEGEIQRHYEQPPPHKVFNRHGQMAVNFNGDYFTVRINEMGRLVTFHVTEVRDPK
jgi:hypothetical protein